MALVPETVKRLAAKKITAVVEASCGEGSLSPDAEYAGAGAAVEPGREAVLGSADAVLRLKIPTLAEVAELREGSVLIAPILPLLNTELVAALAQRKVTTVAVDAIPRTTVAQMMDVLSSQATCSGYYAVLLAASALPRFMPMLITAAGTIAPAKVLILGAGVAGLQAIGTARRLGAVVEAFDVRKVVKEQVESLGARFVEVDASEDAQTAGGYAKEASEEYKKKQSELLAKHLAKSDACVTTALIPGRRAPILITEEMVRGMKPGSVIVDLAAEQQGNCALTEPGATVVRHGVTIVGALDLPSSLAVHASQMYSRNMEKLLLHLTKDGEFKWNFDDEIIRGATITHEGKVLHPQAAEKVAALQKEAPADKPVETPGAST